MTRYNTYSHVQRVEHGVLDNETGYDYVCGTKPQAEHLAGLLNRGTDCRFNCRAQREADYLQGWVDRDRDCPIAESGKRCAKRYVDGAESGLKNPLRRKVNHDRRMG